MKTKFKKNNKKTGDKGFVILLTTLISSLVLFMGISVFNILNSQLLITRINKNSQSAFYAADAGVECVLYWDFKMDGFSTSSPSNITCNEKSYTINPVNLGGGNYEWVFYMNFQPEPYCTEVIVEKDVIMPSLSTKIESRGYSSGYNPTADDCSESKIDKVQRAVRIRY